MANLSFAHFRSFTEKIPRDCHLINGFPDDFTTSAIFVIWHKQSQRFINLKLFIVLQDNKSDIANHLWKRSGKYGFQPLLILFTCYWQNACLLKEFDDKNNL